MEFNHQELQVLHRAIKCYLTKVNWDITDPDDWDLLVQVKSLEAILKPYDTVDG